MERIKDNFEEAMCLLMINSPVCFNIIIGIDITKDDRIDTMGVRVWDGRIELRYNEDFVNSLHKYERNFVLIHEMLHVLLHHCTWRQSSDDRMRYIDNIAMDLEINSIIREGSFIKRPRFKEDNGIRKANEEAILLPSQFGFKEGLSYEQYRNLLRQKFPPSEIQFIVSDGNGGGGDGSDDSDDNGDNDQQSGSSGSKQKSDKNKNSGSGEYTIEIDPNCPIGKITSGRMDKQHGKDYNEDVYADDWVRSQVERIKNNNLWGDTPAGTVDKILKAQEQPLDWAGMLRLEAGHFISFEKVYTRRRWDRHFGKPFLGCTMKSVEPVAVYADTSASVGGSDLGRFIVEIERIAHYTQVMLYCFDTEVKKPEEPMLFSRESIESIEFVGRGGTSFRPIFEHAKKHEIHQVIVLTDGCAEDISKEEIGDSEVIWVITKNGQTSGKPGVVVEMN